MWASSLQLAPCLGCAGGRLEFHWSSWLWHWRVGTNINIYRGIHQGISQCQFQQVCVHVSRRTPWLEISFWWFVAVGIYVDGNSSSTAVPILEGYQCPPGVRLHLPAIISLYRWESSANSRVWDEVTHWGKSFKYTRNNNGPSTVPWGTPDVTDLVSDELPSRTIVWSRWERKVAATHCTRCLREPCTYRKKLDGLVDQFTLTPAIQIDSASKFSPLKWSTHFFLSIMVHYFFS